MPAPVRLTLDAATRTAVAARYAATRAAAERTRCQMVLLAADGRTCPQIAAVVRTSPDTVRRVLHRFAAEGLAGVATKARTGRPRVVTPAWEAALRRVIDLAPRAVGVPSAVWTTELLAAYLAEATGLRVSLETVRVHLHRLEYVCKRPTWTLKRKATEQPEWAKNA